MSAHSGFTRDMLPPPLAQKSDQPKSSPMGSFNTPKNIVDGGAPDFEIFGLLCVFMGISDIQKIFLKMFGAVTTTPLEPIRKIFG